MGKDVKRVWSKKHPGAFLFASDSAKDATGIFYDGHFVPPLKRLEDIGEANGDVAYVYEVPVHNGVELQESLGV